MLIRPSILTILLYFLLSFTILAVSDEETYADVILPEITSVYDGNTFRATNKEYPPVIGYRIAIRVAGIDCPELKDKNPKIEALALQAKQYTIQRLREGKVVKLVNMLRDNYFRICAIVLVDGSDLGHD